MVCSRLFSVPAQFCPLLTVAWAGPHNCLIIAFLNNMHLWTHSPTLSAGTSPIVCLTDKCSHCPSVHTTWVIRMGMKYRPGFQRAALASLMCHKHCHLITLTIVADEYIWIHSQKHIVSIPHGLQPFLFFCLCILFPLSFLSCVFRSDSHIIFS